MANALNHLTRYQQTEIETASPLDLVVLLYKGAITRLKQADKCFEDVEKRVNALNKASAIIGELQTALDLEEGGQIAASLNQLYSYMLQRLWVVNSRQQPEALREVIDLLTSLERAWSEARENWNRHSPLPLTAQIQPSNTQG